MKTYKTAYDKIKEEIDRAYEELDAYGYPKQYSWNNSSKQHEEVKKPRPKPKKKVVKKPNIKVIDNFIDWPLAA